MGGGCALGAHAERADVCADVVVDGGRERQVEEAVGVASPRQRGQMGVEPGEGACVVVATAQVGVSTEEGRQRLTLILRHLTDAENVKGNKSGFLGERERAGGKLIRVITFM